MASVCLYCGSRPGARVGHVAAAREVGRGIAEAGFRLVYGAGDRGLMGEAARAAQGAGARILGFIPQHLVDWEVAKRDIDALIVTDTMQTRKRLMLENADAVLALPGGPGTLDELVEVLTWRNLGLHAKPVVLLNLEGYWDPLLTLFRHFETEGFVGEDFGRSLEVVATPAEALAALRAALSPATSARV